MIIMYLLFLSPTCIKSDVLIIHLPLCLVPKRYQSAYLKSVSESNLFCNLFRSLAKHAGRATTSAVTMMTMAGRLDYHFLWVSFPSDRTSWWIWLRCSSSQQRVRIQIWGQWYFYGVRMYIKRASSWSSLGAAELRWNWCWLLLAAAGRCTRGTIN